MEYLNFQRSEINLNYFKIHLTKVKTKSESSTHSEIVTFATTVLFVLKLAFWNFSNLQWSKIICFIYLFIFIFLHVLSIGEYIIHTTLNIRDNLSVSKIPLFCIPSNSS